MPDLPLTAFDLAALLIVVLSVLFALLRGAVREALTIVTWGGAALVAYYGFAEVQPLTRRTIESEILADATALAVAFIVPLIVFKVIAAILAERLLARRLLGPADRIAGGLFGLLRGALIVCVAYLGLSLVVAPDRQPDWLRDARLRPYVEEGAALLERFLPEPGERAPAAGRARAGGERPWI